MFCRRTLLLLTLTTLAVSLFVSCNRRRKHNVERLAIEPFENLSSDSKLDWAGRAISSALVYDLAPAGDLYAEPVDSVSGGFTAQASRMLEGYFSERNGRLTITATFENLGKTKTLASFELSGPAAEGTPVLLVLLWRSTSL